MDLDGVGARCALSSCATLDYLPLRCNHCQLQFCAEHHGHAAHSCRSAPTVPFVPTCPICAAPVPATAGLTADAAMARHVDAGCPRRARSNKLCAKADCRARDIAPVLCRACGDTFCLEHRLEADHDCAKAGAASATGKADNPLAAAMSRLQAGGAGNGDSGKKKISLPRRTRSKSPRGAVKGVGATAGSASSSKVLSSKKVLTTFSNQPSSPKKPSGAAAFNVEDALTLAVYFAPQLERQPEYWLVNRRWSAGKVLDTLRLPDLAGDSRFALYIVRRSGERITGANLLPRITPLRDSREGVKNFDAVVVEAGESGLSPEWVNVVSKNKGLDRLQAMHAEKIDGLRPATKAKCVLV